MRKYLFSIAALSVALIGALPTLSSAATTSAGKACTRAGTTAFVLEKKFTCIKSGTKLIWDKGVATPKSTPKPGLKSTTKANPSPTPSARLTIHGKTTSSPNPSAAISKSVSPSASAKPSPTNTAAKIFKIGDMQNPIPVNRDFKIGGYTIQVLGAKADVSQAVCKANVYNDGCLGDNADDKNVVDPKSETKWIAVTVSITNNSSSELTPSDNLTAELIGDLGKPVEETDFVSDYEPLFGELVLAPGTKGTADLLFQVSKTFPTTKTVMGIHDEESQSGSSYYEVDYGDYVTAS